MSQSETLTRVERGGPIEEGNDGLEKNKLEQLKELESESQGKWVKCYCTNVDPDNLTFRFETVHGRVKGMDFDVPDTLPGSKIQQFLDSVDRAAVNVGLMEGDQFWMHMENETITDEPPSQWRSKISDWWQNQYVPIFNSREVTDTPRDFSPIGSTLALTLFYPLFLILSPFLIWRGEHDSDTWLSMGIISSLVWSITIIWGMLGFP